MATDLHHEAGGDDAAHDHHAFDPEPIRELPADEPQTPMWLPAVGLALFVIFGIYVALGGGDEAPTEEGIAEPVAERAGGAEPPAAAPAPDAAAPPGPTGRPFDRLSPDQRKQLEDRLRTLRERQPQGARPTPAPAAPPRDPHEGHGH